MTIFTEGELADLLFRAQEHLFARAYCPFSGLAVVAFAKMLNSKSEKERVFAGVNIENAAFPVGICAERNAISAGITAGFPKLASLAVFARTKEGELVECLPCGMCRQFAMEFALEKGVTVYLKSKSGIEWVSLRDLLPRAFTCSTEH